MSWLVPARPVRALALGAAAVLLLSGCQIVSRVIADEADVMGRGGRAIASCGVLTVAPDASGAVDPETLDATVAIIRERLTVQALPEATADALPPDRIAVALPSGDDGSWREAIERAGRMEIVGVPPAFDQQVEDGRPLPAGMDGQVILDQSAILGASLSEDAVANPAIALTLDEAGAAAFDAYAAEHLMERVAIVVDGLVVSAPTLQASHFGGQVQILGSFTEPEVRSLLVALTTHPLPTGVTETSWTTAEDGACPTP